MRGFHRTFRVLKENQKLRENRIIVLSSRLNSLEMKLAALSLVSVMTRRDFLCSPFRFHLLWRNTFEGFTFDVHSSASEANFIRLRIVRSLTLL